ncbi:MAG: extracellular catalytic domain type 1 short-chain-length polyhydroxyalkanoate depolymerase [Caldimonas sp.]
MKNLLDKALREATRLTGAAKLAEATTAIQRALGDSVSNRSARTRLAPNARSMAAALVGKVAARAPDRGLQQRAAHAEDTVPKTATRAAADTAASFEEQTYTGPSGTRSYKLFVPGGHTVKPLPLVVMLHGCAQSPDDFAAGTRMNELAQQRGFLVLYPAQAPRSNTSKCWNWFVPGDQRRGGGEPDLLAGMTRHVMAAHPVDPARVYVAGLSAGGAMADILGREYPDLYAAVGVHSGLPQGAAHDVASAFAAMRHGADGVGQGVSALDRRSESTHTRERRSGVRRAPIIVFHGDRDNTVHPSNGTQVIDAVLGADLASRDRVVAPGEPSTAGGREVTRTVHRRPGAPGTEPSLAEHWVVHGTGHAWSGGSPAGSYTDAAGPDASQEMIRFFFEHPRRGP